MGRCRDANKHGWLYRWMDAEMHVCMDGWLTFITPVWYSIENLIDFSITGDLHRFSSSIWLNVNVIIPHIGLKKKIID